jgi:peptidoglycan/xylan/chitin deacetylase (PgdA/CDA1 family)
LGKIYFTCSFDDGDVLDLRLANLLNKYGIKGTFYIPKSCDLVSKSLSENEIKELSQLVEIGGHTLSHCVLTHIKDSEAYSEIFNCKVWLENIIGEPVFSFCPPTGRFYNQHVSFQKKAGFQVMRTVQMLSHSLEKVRKEGGFVTLPTTIQVYNHDRIDLIKNNLKRFEFGNFSSLRKLFDKSWEKMSRNYITYLARVSNNTIDDCYFHLWGHSWEIEKYSLWGDLEKFLKSLGEMDEIIYSNNSELAVIAKNKISK